MERFSFHNSSICTMNVNLDWGPTKLRPGVEWGTWPLILNQKPKQELFLRKALYLQDFWISLRIVFWFQFSDGWKSYRITMHSWLFTLKNEFLKQVLKSSVKEWKLPKFQNRYWKPDRIEESTKYLLWLLRLEGNKVYNYPFYGNAPFYE